MNEYATGGVYVEGIYYLALKTKKSLQYGTARMDPEWNNPVTKEHTPHDSTDMRDLAGSKPQRWEVVDSRDRGERGPGKEVFQGQSFSFTG